jgi:hypothetical protein
MNTTEHLVEVYYRQQGCFTATDIKVERGNNRQLDLLAFNYKTKLFYHIEVSVAHGEHWAASLNDIKEKMRFKYFGEPLNKRPDNPNTDFAKGKKYLEPIKATYSKFGIDYNEIKRVWCVWCLNDTSTQEIEDWKKSLALEYGLQTSNFEILSFRDEVLPKLLHNIGTAYYDDELLRTLSLIKEYNKQTAQI